MDTTTTSLEQLATSLEGVRSPGQSREAGVDKFLDLELPMSVVLGRAVMPLEEVLKLTAGSLVELDAKVADPVEVFVQGKLVARGEVVSANGNYGVRITEIAAGQQRFSR